MKKNIQIIERRRNYTEQFPNDEDLNLLKRFNKDFRNKRDIYISQLEANGVHFYGFTLNLREYIGNNKLEQVWKNIHILVEQFIQELKQNVNLIEFVYLSIEEHKGKQQERENNKKYKQKIIFKHINTLVGYPYIHGIIGIRTLLGKNDVILMNLKIIFDYYYKDLLIKELKGNFNIKRYWNYIIKENKWYLHRFVIYSSFYSLESGALRELLIEYLMKIKYPLEYSKENEALNENIKGLGEYIKDYSKTTIITIWNLYLLKNEFFVYKNKIYKKLTNSKYSWEFLYDLSYLKDNIFIIIENLISIYYIHLNNLNLKTFLIENVVHAYNLIIQQPTLLAQIKFNNYIIEFKDGLYFLQQNYFLYYKNNKNLLKKIINININNFFNNNFKYIKDIKPIKWLELLKLHFQNNEEKLDEFCVNLGSYFNTIKDVEYKQKTLCIIGDFNSGKTMLVANIITQVIGIENIGIISNKETFAFEFEQIEDKQLIICDGFRYIKNNKFDLLNLFDGDIVLYDKKSEKKEFCINNNIPIMFLFNNNINEKMLENLVFINTLIIYTFTYILFKNNELNEEINNIKNILKNELLKIIIYCNNLYFTKNGKINKNKKIKLLKNLIINDNCSKEFLLNFLVKG